jgi:hypothetical protein
MDPAGSAYCVFGADLWRAEVFHIGWATKPLRESKQEILRELAKNSTPHPDHGLAAALAHAETDVFELETLSSTNEAEEAVAFWRNYFRFLGLSVIGSDPVFTEGKSNNEDKRYLAHLNPL